MDTLRDLSVGGILVLLVLREVLAFLSRREDAKNKNGHSGSECLFNAEIRDYRIKTAIEDVIAVALSPTLLDIKENLEKIWDRVNRGI